MNSNRIRSAPNPESGREAHDDDANVSSKHYTPDSSIRAGTDQDHITRSNTRSNGVSDMDDLQISVESRLLVQTRRMFPVATKYMQDLWRERTVMLFFSLLLFIALSVSLLLITLTFIYNPEVLVSQPVAVGVVGTSPAFSQLVMNPKITVYEYPSTEAALIDFDKGLLSAVFTAHSVSGSVSSEANASVKNARATASEQTALSQNIREQTLNTTVIDTILPSSPVQSAVVLSLAKTVFADAEENLERERFNDSGLVWSLQVKAGQPVTRGSNTMFELIIGLIIPLFVLIPAFVIGNLFVDTLAQEFEQKLHQTVFTAISPWRYVLEYLLFGMMANVVIVSAFVGLLFLRFTFVSNFWSVVLYALVFGLALFLFALNCAFYLRRKEVAQTVYSFGVVALFLLSPFFSLSPLFTLTELLLGHAGLFFISLGIMALTCTVLLWTLHRKLAKEYYL